MASGLKVRLDDGSEVGPLDLTMVRSWYEQGLISAESAVQRAGSKSWMKLSQAVDLRAWGNFAVTPQKGKKAVRSKAQAAPGTRGRQEEEARESRGSDRSFADHWGTSLAGALLLLAAGAAGYLYWHPEDAVSPLDRAPWWPIALGLVAAALALLPGWELSRKLARVAALLVAVAAFPLLGILFAQGVRGAALLTVLGAFVSFMALFAFLADPTPHWARAALTLLALGGGGYVIGRFGYAPETSEQREVREAITSNPRFSDPSLGVNLELPPGWFVLKPDSEVMAAPADARVTFAHPRQRAFGYLLTASAPPGIATLDAWLNRVLGERLKAHAGLKEDGRTEVAVGRLTGKRATAAFGTGDGAHRESATVWRDGWVYYALVAWAPVSAGATDLEALTTGVVTTGALAQNLQQAIQKVTLEVPALTPAAAELLMARSEAKVLEPDQAFRRSFEAVASALPTWKGGEAQEMGRLLSACYRTLTGRDRTRLAAYVEKVQKHQHTTPEEDREILQLMKTAVLRLTGPQRERLQALYQKAVEAAGAV
jgi:hypothetical protein